MQPVTYTFTGQDVDCGVEPGVASSGSSDSSSTTTTTASGGSTAVQAPSLVTSANQEQLTSSAGTAKILINGELVEVELVQAPEELRRTAAGARTFAEVRALQTLAQDMVAAVQAVLGEGVTLPITVTNTSTGATITGLVTDPVTGEALAVPVEDVLLIVNESIALMVGGADGAGDPANIAFDGVLEFGEGGYVAVLAYGLTPGAAGEVVVMSSPRLLDSFAVGADGGVAVQAQIPTDLEAGDHTVVVAIDGQSASLGFRVLAPGVLPSTGQDSPVSYAVLVLAMGAFAALMVTRRRNMV
jgi:LPXTG-motif cell wall-anchored protein